MFSTLYGDVGLASPRLHRCGVGAARARPPRRRCANSCRVHVAPERLYLEARWASLAPYGAAAGLLADVLPIASGDNATTLRQHVLRVAERAEAELGEERSAFVDGCPAEWAELPTPEGRIVVGLDGGYVRDWDERKTNFELIVGRSMPEDRGRPLHRAGARLRPQAQAPAFDHLQAQGLQANQEVTFANSSAVRASSSAISATTKSACSITASGSGRASASPRPMAESTVNAVVSKRVAKRQQTQCV